MTLGLGCSVGVVVRRLLKRLPPSALRGRGGMLCPEMWARSDSSNSSTLGSECVVVRNRNLWREDEVVEEEGSCSVVGLGPLLSSRAFALSVETRGDERR